MALRVKKGSTWESSGNLMFLREDKSTLPAGFIPVTKGPQKVSEVYVQRTNLALNPTFTSLGQQNDPEESMGIGGSATVSLSTDWSLTGGNSVKVTGGKANSSSAYASMGNLGQLGTNWASGRTVTVGATIHLPKPLSSSATHYAARGIDIGYTSPTGSNVLNIANTSAPNTAGDHRVVVTTTLPQEATGLVVRLMNGSSNTSDIVYWDGVTIEEGETDGSWFDENTPLEEKVPRRVNLATNMGFDGGKDIFNFQSSITSTSSSSSDWADVGLSSLKADPGDGLINIINTGSPYFIEKKRGRTFTLSCAVRMKDDTTFETWDIAPHGLVINFPGTTLDPVVVRPKYFKGAQRLKTTITIPFEATDLSVVFLNRSDIPIWIDSVVFEEGRTDGSRYTSSKGSGPTYIPRRNLAQSPKFTTLGQIFNTSQELKQVGPGSPPITSTIWKTPGMTSLRPTGPTMASPGRGGVYLIQKDPSSDCYNLSDHWAGETVTIGVDLYLNIERTEIANTRMIGVGYRGLTAPVYHDDYAVSNQAPSTAKKVTRLVVRTTLPRDDVMENWYLYLMATPTFATSHHFSRLTIELGETDGQWFEDKKPAVGNVYVDLSKETDLNGRFFTWGDLQYVDQLDCSSATNMENFLRSSTALKSARSIDTRSATNMGQFFKDTNNMVTAPTMDTSKATNVVSMFHGCSSLQSVPPLDFSSARSLQAVFDSCNSLVETNGITTSSSFTGTTRDMFARCSKLNVAPLFNTQWVEVADYMFYECKQLEHLPAYDFSSLQSASSMFSGASWLDTLPKLNFPKLQNASRMFYAISYLANLGGTNFGKPTNTFAMFWSNIRLKDVPIIDLSASTDVTYMFAGCYEMVGAVNFTLTKASSLGWMFQSCRSLTDITLNGLGSVTNTESAFQNCKNLTSLKLNGLKSSVTVSDTKLDATALNTLFDSLGTANSGATVFANGTPGAGTCDKTIATKKGWTVVTS